MDKTKMASYGNDNTIYAVEDNINNLRKTLEIETSPILKRFRVKGRQSPKFASFFKLRNRISFKNLNEQKKRIKKY